MSIMKPTKTSPEVATVAEKANALFANEQAEAALELVEQWLASGEHVRLLRLKARLLVFFEREAEAKEVLERILLKAWYPGFWELAQAGLPHSYALLNDRHKVAYFPVRKCSSTTMHNIMALLAGREAKGEDIHDNVAQYELIDRSSEDAGLADYLSVLVVRSPVDRIRSYFDGNIAGRSHLVVDTNGKDSFYGLNTRPSYEEFLENFHAYRRTFMTVRNHTDPLTGYVGTDAGLFDWIGNTSQTNDLIDVLAKRSGLMLPKLRDMRRAHSAYHSKALKPAEQSLLSFYEADVNTFGNWF